MNSTETQKLNVPITHGELFAGIGGFGLGFDRAGMETKWHVEIDGNCQKLLSDKFPDALVLSDVREVGKHNLPRVGVISFGSPCQDLSIAGKRKGLDGERSGLFFEAIRIVDELKPAFAVWENVPGALSSNSGRDFAAVLSAFRECGARDIAWRILDAQYFGVAQRRRRVFVVADFGGERAAEVLFESEGLQRNIETGRETGKDVAYSLRSNPSHSGDKGDGGINTTLVFDEAQITSKEHRSHPSEISQPLNTLGRMSVFTPSSHGEYREGTGTLRANGGDIGGGSEMLVARSQTARNTRIDAESETLIASTLSTSLGHHGWSVGDQDINNLIAPSLCVPSSTGRNNVDNEAFITAFTPRRTEFDGVENCSPTLNTGGGGMGSPAVSGQLIGVRRLTPTECERLQGFPDGWTDGFADTIRYRMLGNAVNVAVSEWLGKQLMHVLTP